jgi:hypothetical protein
MKRAILSASLVLAALLPACGGGGSSSPTTTTPTTTQPPCAQSVVLQGGSTGLGSFIVDYLPFATTTTGRFDVAVDWTFPSTPIAVYVVRGSCSIDELNARTCDFVVRSEASTTPKPRRLSASNVAAGSFDLIVGNAGDQDEAVSAQVVLSSAGCPTVAAGPGALRTSEIESAHWSARRR